MLELHRSRFVEWQPAAVVALAVAPGGFTVALARENGDLEIYDTADWRCTARVPGHDGAAISSLAWCAPFDGGLDDDGGDEDAGVDAPPCRLLSAGLDGQITEWDLNTLRARGATDSHGGSVWALAAETSVKRDRPQRVAAACDDGCVRVLTLAGGDGVGAGLHHRRSFNRVDGRLLSLAWTRCGRAIAAGSSRGAVHVFDCEAYAELARITVGAGDGPGAGDAEERCVWALQYLPCGTLVSGSSDGDVTFWDGEHATKISAHRQHKADVLALAATPDGRAVFASGVDSRIAVFERAADGSGDASAGSETYKWTFTGAKRPHTHDVRALAMAAAPPAEDKSGTAAGKRGGERRAKPVLLSGGNDAQLLAYPAEKFRKRHPVRVVSVPQRTPIAMTGGGLATGKTEKRDGGRKRESEKRAAGETKKDASDSAERLVSARRGAPSPPLLLCDHARWLDVWRLGEGAAADFSADALAKAKRHDGTMKLSAAPRHVLRANLGGKRRTTCSAISPDGAFFRFGRVSPRFPPSASAPKKVLPGARPSADETMCFDPVSDVRTQPSHQNVTDLSEDAAASGRGKSPEAFDFRRAADSARVASRRRPLIFPNVPPLPSFAGTLIAASDTHALRLFELRRDVSVADAASDEGWTLRKKDPVAGATSAGGAHLLTFAPDGRRLVAVAAGGAAHVIDLESWEVMQTLRAHLPKPSPAAVALAKQRKREEKRDALASEAGMETASRPARAADAGGPAVSHARVSADGQWLAVVTTSSGRSGGRDAGVHVYNLDALKLHASLPPPPGCKAWPPVAATAFSADGVLALALRDNAIVAYDAERAKAAPWSAAPAGAGAAARTALASMPGQICALSFDPTPGSSVLLAQTPAAIARVDLAAKPDAVRPGAKRSAPENAEKPIKRRRKSGKGGDGGGDVALRHGGNDGNAAGAVKMASLDDPCLFLGYFAPGRALMVERPWKEVLKQIPEPLYRHRFGT